MVNACETALVEAVVPRVERVVLNAFFASASESRRLAVFVGLVLPPARCALRRGSMARARRSPKGGADRATRMEFGGLCGRALCLSAPKARRYTSLGQRPRIWVQTRPGLKARSIFAVCLNRSRA